MVRNLGARLRPIRLNYRLIGLVVVVVGLTTFAQSRPGQSALRHLGVVGPAQRYTELAFVGAQHLPTTLPRAATALHLPFTITNREGRTQQYGWSILKRLSATMTQKLTAGEASLRDGQEAYVDPAVTISCTSYQTRVAVRLTSGQVIDFVARCSGRSPAMRR